MTHDELVQRAGKWLRNSMSCRPVLLEKGTMYGIERPDAIGYLPGSGNTILIECKVSKSDFSSDRSKVFRKNTEIGMGVNRFFMVEKGFEIPGSLPSKWGLLIVHPRTVRKQVESGGFASNKNAEIQLLLSHIWWSDNR